MMSATHVGVALAALAVAPLAAPAVARKNQTPPPEPQCVPNWTCEPTAKVNDEWFGRCTNAVDEFRYEKHAPLAAPCVEAFIDTVRSCAANARRTTTGDIRGCVNVAPAGTGTESIAGIVEAAGLPHCHKVATGGCCHHSHSSWPVVDIIGRGVSCAIVTLRDPVSRLESGYRFHKQYKVHASPPKPFEKEVTGYKRHYDAPKAPYNKSAPPPSSVNIFVRPMILYLAGLTRDVCDAGFQLHVLCTERLSHDARAMGRRLNVSSDIIERNLMRHRRSQFENDSHKEWVYNMSLLTPESKRFVEEELMRADFLLHQALCVDDDGSGSVEPPSSTRDGDAPPHDDDEPPASSLLTHVATVAVVVSMLAFFYLHCGGGYERLER